MIKKILLKDLIKINNGQKYDFLQKGNVPVYGTGGIINYVDNFLYDGESMLLPRKGTLKNIMYVNKKFWTIDTMYWSKGLDKNVDLKFLYFYIKNLNLSPIYKGSTLPSMTMDSYYNLEILLPNKNEQNKISNFLHKIDKKIELNTKINNNLSWY